MTSLSYSEPVLLVGAGPTTREDFDAARIAAPHIVAVDGGYDALAGWGVVPEAVLGDMDSIRSEVAAGVERLAIDEQDSTDLEKALQCVDAPLVIGIGFLGGRLDHTLAAMHALVGFAGAAILLGGEDLALAAPTEWRAALEPGTRISFYPVSRVPAVGSMGLRWPIDGLLMEGGRQIGTSNEVVSNSVAVWFAERGAVTILPRTSLAAVIDSLI